MEKGAKAKLKTAIVVLFFIIAFIASICSAVALKINEVMYDSPGGDDGKEYIEIFEENCNSVNASMLKLFENNVSHNLQFNDSSIILCGYYVIVNDVDDFILAYNYTNISIIVKSSFSLSNAGEFIAIKNSTDTFSSFDYRTLTNIANGNGKSLEFNGTWHESITNGTPGTLNTIEMAYEQIDLTNLTNLTNSTALENVSQNITSNTTNNSEIINLTYINATENQTIPQNNYLSKSCNVTVGISGQDVFEDNKIKYYNILSNTSFDFEIEYWIEDLEGNIVKSKITTSNFEQKSWTAGKEPAYVIKNRIKWIDCNNSAPAISSEKLFAIKNNSYSAPESISLSAEEKDNQSKIILIETDGETIEFNETMSARIVIYKGNTLKTVVNIWVENETKKFSDVFKFYAQQKYSESDVTAVLNLKDINACAPVDAYIVVEGLGIIARERVVIENTNNSCRGQTKINTNTNKITGNAAKPINNTGNNSKNSSLSKGSATVNSSVLLDGKQSSKVSVSAQTESNLNDAPVENTKKRAIIVYESPLEKAKKYTNFAIAGLFVLLIAIIWLKKDRGKDTDGKARDKREDKRRMAALPRYNRNTWKAKRACRENITDLHFPDKGEKGHSDD